MYLFKTSLILNKLFESKNHIMYSMKYMFYRKPITKDIQFSCNKIINKSQNQKSIMRHSFNKVRNTHRTVSAS